MTMEQTLEKIKQDHGETALQDGSRLMGFFTDYSHGQLRPQANALRTFLDCKGNERVLNLQNASGLTQRTEYHRLVQEMVSDYNMQEDAALEVCGAFWRVVIGTELPVPADNFVSEPAPPVPKPTPVLDQAPKQEPCFEVPPDSRAIPPKPLKAEPRMSWLERITFVLGCGVVCLIFYGVTLVWNTEDISDVTVGSVMLFVALGIVIAMQYAVWKGKIPHLFSVMLDTDGAGFPWFIFLLVSIGFAIWGIANLLNGWINNIFELTLWIITPWYYILWNAVGIIPIYHEIKANKKGETK